MWLCAVGAVVRSNFLNKHLVRNYTETCKVLVHNQGMCNMIDLIHEIKSHVWQKGQLSQLTLNSRPSCVTKMSSAF